MGNELYLEWSFSLLIMLMFSFAFIEFVEPHHATLARQRIDGGKFDSKHTFAINDYDDLDKYKSIPEEYVQPQLKDDDKVSFYSLYDSLSYVVFQQVYSWLLDDEHGNGDQFIIRYDNESEIYWNDPDKKPDLIYKKKVCSQPAELSLTIARTGLNLLFHGHLKEHTSLLSTTRVSEAL